LQPQPDPGAMVIHNTSQADDGAIATAKVPTLPQCENERIRDIMIIVQASGTNQDLENRLFVVEQLVKKAAQDTSNMSTQLDQIVDMLQGNGRKKIGNNQVFLPVMIVL
jgi:hypothetical protein